MDTTGMKILKAKRVPTRRWNRKIALAGPLRLTLFIIHLIAGRNSEVNLEKQISDPSF